MVAVQLSQHSLRRWLGPFGAAHAAECEEIADASPDATDGHALIDWSVVGRRLFDEGHGVDVASSIQAAHFRCSARRRIGARTASTSWRRIAKIGSPVSRLNRGGESSFSHRPPRTSLMLVK